MIDSIESRHLPGLDLLRFLLSVVILIVHFPFFSSPFVNLAHYDMAIHPFFDSLHLVYKFGGLAVEAFWMISGIIFFYFYLDVIQGKKISLLYFTGLRFSRLYPLHLLTLFSVAILQYLYQAKMGTTFIYGNNDIQHFILNLGMIASWNAKFGLSFNGPFWSVSVELFVYIIFFIVVSSGVFKRSINFFLIVVLFFLFYCLGILSPFYDCLFYFFTGVLVARYFRKIHFGWLTLAAVVSIGFLAFKYCVPAIRNNFYAIRIIDLAIKTGIFIILILFFSQLFFHTSSRVKKFLRELGNMTYAVYMIHVSVSITLILLFYSYGITFFNTKLFFVSYLGVTSILGYTIYRLFELPVQEFIRKRLPGRPPNKIAAAHTPTGIKKS